tara:strand:- start:1952 stop:2533 length:582 start_codon:yes stop_codon:yes gene_type:complete
MNIKHDKEKVLNKGVKLFWNKGYNNLGVEEICKTTGMTKGAFYNAFKSKENFLLNCIESYATMNTKYLLQLLNNENGKAIDRLLYMYVHMLENQPEIDFCGCMTNNMMSEVGAINNAVSNATAKAFDRLLVIIEPSVIEAQKDGDISPTLNTSAVTELLHTSFFGVLTRAKSTKDHQQGITTITLLIKSLKTA